MKTVIVKFTNEELQKQFAIMLMDAHFAFHSKIDWQGNGTIVVELKDDNEDSENIFLAVWDEFDNSVDWIEGGEECWIDSQSFETNRYND